MQSEKTLQFIEKAIKVHGDKYGYSLVEYIKNNVKVKIICQEHGEFSQRPFKHLKGQNCPKCKGFNKTTVEIINEFKIVHGDKYGYSLVEYRSSKDKVKIICPNNHIFEQLPSAHLNGFGCNRCLGFNKTNEEIKIEMSKIHNDFYKYKLNDKKYYAKDKIDVICPNHGLFNCTINNHLRGKGCPKCVNRNLNDIEIIDKFNKKHNNKYTYKNLSYKNPTTKIKITCDKHGVFEQTPNSHLNGSGCPKCSSELNGLKIRGTQEDFIKRSIEVHGDKYGYSLVEYRSSKDKVKIECKKHGIFEQTPNNHLFNKGCPKCSKSMSNVELKLFNYLKSTYDINGSYRNLDILGRQHLDIFIPEYNIAIEYQGIQHFQPVDFFGGDKDFKITQKRDQRKREACEKHGIKLFYFSYDLSYVPNDYPYKVYSDEQELLEAINNYIEEQKEKLAS